MYSFLCRAIYFTIYVTASDLFCDNCWKEHCGQWWTESCDLGCIVEATKRLHSLDEKIGSNFILSEDALSVIYCLCVVFLETFAEVLL